MPGPSGLFDFVIDDLRTGDAAFNKIHAVNDPGGDFRLIEPVHVPPTIAALIDNLRCPQQT